MANRILLPRDKVELNGNPVLFLLGPVFAAGGWQKKAVNIIRSKNSSAYIAIPDYSGFINGEMRASSERAETCFDRQLHWEQHYLGIAENNGAIVSWLPKQLEQMPISKNTGFPQTYARDTRPETGGWGWGLLRCRPQAHVAVGGETGFDGLEVTKENYRVFAPHIPFRNNLEDVCYDALKFVD
jgi:hypothetical protein